MIKFFELLSKLIYIFAVLVMIYSVYIFQTDSTLGIFLGVTVPILLLVGPCCPWGSLEEEDNWIG